LLVAPVVVAELTPTSSLTVAEAILAYYRHAMAYYADQPKSLAMIRYAIEAIHDTFGPGGARLSEIPAAEFRGRALKEVRDYLTNVRMSRRDPGQRLARKYVNKLVKAIQMAWTWLVGEELVPADSLASLRSVTAMREGKGGREVPRVSPAPAWAVDATLPYLSPTVRTMVQVQRWCGARPGEICAMRRGDISTSPTEPVRLPKTTMDVAAIDSDGVLVWLYVPGRHKTQWRGRPRVVAIGPLAQEMLRPYLDRATDAHLFTPALAVGEQMLSKRAARRSKVQPSQVERSRRRAKRRRQRPPGDHYTTASYGRAIAYAIRRANRDRARAGLPPIPQWRPNQLRHFAATEASERFDESTAAAMLGHSGLDMIATYVKQAVRKAAGAAAAMG
jgi:integrase